MTKFSQDGFDKILERISDGESLKSICDDKDMPSRMSFFRWIASDKELEKRYKYAREEQADAIFDEVLCIADDARNDWMAANDGDNAAYKLNGEHVQRSRIRIDARKWVAGKLRPKKYGDKLDLNHSGDLTVNISGDDADL